MDIVSDWGFEDCVIQISADKTYMIYLIMFETWSNLMKNKINQVLFQFKVFLYTMFPEFRTFCIQKFVHVHVF